MTVDNPEACCVAGGKMLLGQLFWQVHRPCCAGSRPGSVEDELMSKMQDQIWHGPTFTIERRQNPAADAVVFRFSGAFTARDMYSSLSPVALHNIFEAEPPRPAPSVNIFDLTEVPYMDSCGLGLVIGHFVRCQNKGVRLIAVGVTARVLDLFKTTRVDQLFPITDTVEEAFSLQAPGAR
jgi:anti-anti-sigma factor